MLFFASEGIGGSEATLLVDDAVAGSFWIWVLVQCPADFAGVFGSQRSGDVAVGGYFSFGDEVDDLVDFFKEVRHELSIVYF